MFAVAPEVDTERTAGRSRSGDKCDEDALADGLEGAGGEDGEGESKGVSGSNSPSGVDAVEAIAKEDVSVLEPQAMRGRGVGEAGAIAIRE